MPLVSQIHVDKLLGNISVNYQSENNTGLDVFPRVPVNKSSDLYRIFQRDFRVRQTKRANKGEAREYDFDISTASYQLEKHALKDYVSDDDRENYELSDLRADTTKKLTEALMRRVEKNVADLFTSTNWSLNLSLSATQQFDSPTSTAASPIPLFDTGQAQVVQNSGFMPNYVIMPHSVFLAFKNNGSVLDRIKHTSRDVTAEMVKGLLDVQSLIMPTQSEDTSALGQTESISPIWGDNAFIGYKPPRPSPMMPSSGYTFMKNKPLVKRWRDEERESEAIEVQIQFQPKVVASLSGFLLIDALA